MNLVEFKNASETETLRLLLMFWILRRIAYCLIQSDFKLRQDVKNDLSYDLILFYYLFWGIAF